MQHDSDDEQPSSSADSSADVPGSSTPRSGPQSREPVPRLPASKRRAVSIVEIVRIGMVAAMLVGVVAMRQPCADGVARFIGQYDTPPPLDAGTTLAPAQPEELLPQGTYVEIKGTMSEEEIRKALEQAGVKDISERPAAREPAAPPDETLDSPSDSGLAQ